MATIYDVAREAGVSPATVSRALNKPAMVRESTRLRVTSAAASLGFRLRTDIDARRRAGMRALGVVVPFSSHPAATRRVAGIACASQSRHHELVLYDHPTAQSRSPFLDILPPAGRVDGIIVVSLPLDDVAAERLHSYGVPALILDNEHALFPSIPTDDESGGALAADHLLAYGHRVFMFVGEDRRPGSPASRRFEGFQRRLRERGIEAIERSVVNGGESAARQILPLLNREHRPSAVFASDDDHAAAVLQAAATLGLRVPDDISVVGYDNSPTASVLGITTISQPLEESGDLAVRMIDDLLASRTVSMRSILRVNVIARRSSGPKTARPHK